MGPRTCSQLSSACIIPRLNFATLLNAIYFHGIHGGDKRKSYTCGNEEISEKDGEDD